MSRELELLIAQTILQGFDAQYGRFLEVTSGAQQRFEQADWHAVQQAMKQRIHLYDHHVGLVVEQLRSITGHTITDAAFLLRVKEHYTHLLPDYPRFEIAESFFNSVYCRLFDHRSLSPERLFIFSSQPEQRFRTLPRPLAKDFFPDHGWEALLTKVLADLPLRLPWQNRARDVDYIIAHLSEAVGTETLQNSHLQVANELFYRNKAAWLVGKLMTPDGTVPFLVPIHRSDEGQLAVDTCLTTNTEASIVFGFARSYFMVYAPQPGALVEWLREILPGKTTAELYMAIGCQKHAKTESYREYLHYIAHADEQFIEAPGIRGMVMLVFTLPGFDRVFKVIKDKFAPQKEMSAAHVRACYQLVKEHDRVGRMADTQEFENFVLDKRQIAPELMALLLQEAPGKITDLGDRIAISHLYIERRMVPLNIWLEQAEGQVLHDAIEEYGNAIRQLAAANIFPGDMLFKNFGVTRHGRVVFYDYDEICYMTEVNFREIPPPRYPEDEFASEPWYSVSPGDVFPEEFRHWLCADPRIGALFEEMHADLFRADYWRRLQTRIKNGHVEDVYAYRRRQRFSVRYGWPVSSTTANSS
ncbi:bifunctional isocitrate dehydrogenase kinase/phosphatase [Leclercia adecarboxylata]|jgi:isocitrate dehydrogenase kinase/phosphatase|uniref:bifunctional isocitrate dehydrogenase kinase/phosphatase n=1 Tax=Leclercia TaxID=83654 RepID=UPI000CDCBFE0|nr:MULTISPECIES: bifunctional isocitrate dehydrogenase kinase/phosphatase [Leclercia]POW67155.1 bifunctional isocitrate dehydrogenase kinase/phosphatase [Leclercia sp. LSNIH4]AUY39185.1 bifunctional isocitrate dehydrogenase kinase/phosphatase [Leclercia sp. LSNIH3]MDQ2129422.1 bifunctional isocitrate dehydrogenase kinase/phosphatase [Leclercia adecarboxylata]MDV7059757.1 bifunctional isocitrate dehydrogenase kinase/phosphatase [Leclercia adecarboxylata]QIG31377.1 bifunctional isocitrate dehydr